MLKNQIKILSGAELIEHRRNTGKNNSQIETKVITNDTNSKLNDFHQKFNDTLSEERVQKLGELSTAIYNDEDKTTELITHKGKFWLSMGYNIGNRKFLNAEEVVFLLEASLLEVRRNRIPISIEEAHTIYLNTPDCSLEEYQIFSHLTRLGYVVIRHRKSINSDDEISTFKRGSEQNSELPENCIKKRKNSSKDQCDADDCMGEASASNRISDFSHVDFPNCAAKWRFKLPVPPSDLLPPNIVITESMCSVNLFAIQNTAALHSKRCHQRRQSYPKTGKDDDYPKLFSWRNTHSRCWSELKEEMKNKTNYPMEPLCKPSYNVKRHTAVNSEPWGQPLSKISYDVYLPTEKFTKNGTMLPNHRLIVTDVKNPTPTVNQLISIQTKFNDSIPIHYAIVCGGEVSFFSLPCVDIPNLM